MSIRRIQVAERMSQAVVHGNTVYTAGQVAQSVPGGTMAAQTQDVLDRIDALLAEAGTDKSKLISTTIWITSMDDFAEMNEIWDAWITPGTAPTRACGEAKLATPEYKVEVIVVASRK